MTIMQRAREISHCITTAPTIASCPCGISQQKHQKHCVTGSICSCMWGVGAKQTCTYLQPFLLCKNSCCWCCAGESEEVSVTSGFSLSLRGLRHLYLLCVVKHKHTSDENSTTFLGTQAAAKFLHTFKRLSLIICLCRPDIKKRQGEKGETTRNSCLWRY